LVYQLPGDTARFDCMSRVKPSSLRSHRKSMLGLTSSLRRSFRSILRQNASCSLTGRKIPIVPLMHAQEHLRIHCGNIRCSSAYLIQCIIIKRHLIILFIFHCHITHPFLSSSLPGKRTVSAVAVRIYSNTKRSFLQHHSVFVMSIIRLVWKQAPKWARVLLWGLGVVHLHQFHPSAPRKPFTKGLQGFF